MSDFDQVAYGPISLDEIRKECLALSKSLDIEIDFRQSDNEDEMYRWIAKDSEQFDGVIINPVGYTGVAIMTFELYRSAIKMISLLEKPVIEVHISNIYSQNAEITQPLHEPEGDMGFICGLGKMSYLLAIKSLARRLTQDLAA